MGIATKTLQYRYDARGNRSAVIDHDGGRCSYSYDAVNRLTQIQNAQGDRTSFSYDSAGRRTLKKLANGTRASFTYDAAGNLTKLYNLKSNGTVLSSFDYTYDKTGNRMAVLESDGSRVTWSYDSAYQLTGEFRTGSSPYRDTFTYDAAGNRLLKNHGGARTTYAYDAANQLNYSQDGSGRTTYTFDADGNQQVVREPSGNRTTYAWDYENRMTSVRLPSGIRNTLAFDADGLRVKLEESTGTKKFVWDDQNYLGETDGSNDTQAIYTNEPLRYGNLVSQRRGATTHWYQFDALGSTRQLTDVSAVVSDTRLYDAWGNAVATTGSTVSPLRWVGAVGYYFDGELGTHYVRARMYEPTMARWLSKDPGVGLENEPLYLYVQFIPLLAVDPSGLQSVLPPIGALCGAEDPPPSCVKDPKSPTDKEKAQCCKCMVYCEAGGTSDACKLAVAWVIKNRIRGKDNFKKHKNACDVISEQGQFSCYTESAYTNCCNNRYPPRSSPDDSKDDPAEKKAADAAAAACDKGFGKDGKDPTDGSQFYHDKSIGTPSFLKKCKEVAVNGCTSFRFYKC